MGAVEPASWRSSASLSGSKLAATAKAEAYKTMTAHSVQGGFDAAFWLISFAGSLPNEAFIGVLQHPERVDL
jgi:hypothetical protein